MKNKKKLWIPVVMALLAASFTYTIVTGKGTMATAAKPVQAVAQATTQAAQDKISAKKVLDIDIPETIPVADSNGKIPTSDDVSTVKRQTVTFGSYYQDKDGQKKTPLQWFVLEEKDGYSLLLSKNIIASKGWVEQGRKDTTWKEADLRLWLDSKFYLAAFSENERNQMGLFHSVQPQNPRYTTPAGEETVDNVALLSYQELIHFMPTEQERKAKPTDYAIAQGCYQNTDGDSAWWLRSPGPKANVPEHLASWGNLGARTHYIDDNIIGVRPAIWVKTDYLKSVNKGE